MFSTCTDNARLYYSLIAGAISDNTEIQPKKLSISAGNCQRSNEF